MKLRWLLLFLVLSFKTAAAIGIAPASLELELEPYEYREKQLILYGDATAESSTSWLQLKKEGSRVKVAVTAPSAAGTYREFVTVTQNTAAEGIAVAVGARIPVTVRVRDTGTIPVATGLLVSFSIVAAGLGLYAAAGKWEKLKYN